MGLIASINTESSNLNIRLGEGTDSSIIGSAAKGSQIEVLSTDNNGWTKVRMNDGTEGYASSQYLKIEEMDLEPDTIPEDIPVAPVSSVGNGKMVEVNTESSSLNVRAGADGNASVVTQAGKGSQLEVLEDDNGSGWTKVRLSDGTEGFVSSQYIKPIDNNTQSLDTLDVDINSQSSGGNLESINSDNGKDVEWSKMVVGNGSKSDVYLKYIRADDENSQLLEDNSCNIDVSSGEYDIVVLDPVSAGKMDGDFWGGDHLYYDKSDGHLVKLVHTYSDGSFYSKYYNPDGSINMTLSPSGGVYYYAKPGEKRYVPSPNYDPNDVNSTKGWYYDDHGNCVGEDRSKGRLYDREYHYEDNGFVTGYTQTNSNHTSYETTYGDTAGSKHTDYYDREGNMTHSEDFDGVDSKFTTK